ncbi:Domain of uncharacterised function (DUF303) [Candidatus Ornithobacterium hominis]|uniref:GDSL-type esterase/lipase family protein n=1 Tax=Candidatus Ornithobacterium hominis TaxID=2497989 RepID=UPI000E5C383B|nr:GDSL-type esterase/lipase family protein [Candidatus Ornithobacterium hominis]SZD72782.1 Domain of uncharacterised function (DUF303) [Candidatus Ornithobacterium hominis]
MHFFKPLKNFLFLFFLLLNISLSGQKKIKLANVGNSVTFGYGIENREQNSYPSQLQNMLGKDYWVENFGKSGATLLNHGHNPYTKTEEYQKALDFAADIVIIHLGLNDTDPRNWPKFRDDFFQDYYDLIESFRKQNPKAKIYICLMTPIFPAHPRFGSSTLTYFEQIQQTIPLIAKNAKTHLIDFYTPLSNREDLFADALHPNAKGAKILAKTVYRAVKESFNALSIDEVFSNNMILQRNKPIRFWGKGKPGSILHANFDKEKKSTTVLADGHWEIEFENKPAGGPYNFQVSDSEKILSLKKLFVGDLWIAAGQSNMAFKLKDDLYFDSLTLKTNPYIKIYDYKPIHSTYDVEWDSAVLEKVNQGRFYLPTQWETLDENKAKDFSAVAYYFSKKIQKETNVPLGIISLAIGGSPTEAWISRSKMQRDPLLLNFLKNWDSDYTDSWVRERVKKNIRRSSNPSQRHPFLPSYLYENGIKVFEKLPIAGAIWYQGESNASNVELHEILFTKMIEDWRERRNSNFPFYFVQLSSMEKGRETWAHFRNSQRLLAEKIPNTKMVVSSDVGDKYDVHPKDKKTIGERLANLALKDFYKLNFNASGPVLENVIYKNCTIILSFSDAKSLKTSDNENLKGFEIAGEDRIFHPAEATISGLNVLLKHKNIKNPKFFRYAWQSYSLGNLTDEDGIPASTFNNPFP